MSELSDFDRMLPLFVLVGGAIFIALTFLILDRFRKEEWKVFADICLDRLEYKEVTYSERRGAMVHHTDYYTVRYNTLYLYGGSILYNIEGKLDGRPGVVKLMRSNRGNWRIDRVFPKTP